MSRFVYKLISPGGAPDEGVLEAVSRSMALEQLDARGGTLVKLAVAADGETGASAGTDDMATRVPAKVREQFTRQLSSLLGAGVPLATALNRLARDAAKPAVGRTWQAIHDWVSDGTSLADAMARLPGVFPQVSTAMVRAGEQGGFLGLVLGQIAEFEERDRDLRSKALGALIYPCVLAVLATAVVVFLLVYFIPRFESMFADFGAALPALTRAILVLSDWLRHWGLVLVGVVVLGATGLRRWLDSAEGRRRWEGWLLALPVAGGLTARFAMTRFCRMLGTLTEAGVPLIHALNVASESLGNQVLLDAVRASVQRVQRGSRLAESLGECPALFPGTVVEIISVAEQTARLDTELIRLADTSERELDRQLAAAVALTEPAMLFVMAAVIGTIVIGMVLPIFALQDYIQ